MELVTDANLQGFYYKPRIDFELLEKYAEGLICLSGCLGGQFSQFILKGEIETAKELASKYKKLFNNDYYIEVQRHPKNEDQCKVTPTVIKLAKELKINLAATTDAHYLCKEDEHVHDVLLAVQTRKTIDDKDRLTLSDNEVYVQSPEEMLEKFKDIPEAVENTYKIVEKCNIDIELGKIRLPHINIPKEHKDPSDYLKSLCYQKFKDRYELNDNKAKERLAFELGIIDKSGFSSYMLIVSDIISWAKSQGIIVGPGRGSAAGSVISYILGITNLDPIKYGLLFERFMNPDRISMPDIDVDIEDIRRQEVISYVSDKYGKDYVAQIITFGTMFARGSIRDAGRALGYPLSQCDRIAKMIPFNTSLSSSLESIKELREEYNDPSSKKLIDIAINLEGVVRHSSTHACGVVIGDKPIVEYSPLQHSREGHVTSQYEMGAIDDLGLLKMDLLGLRNLSVISDCQRLIKEQLGDIVDVNKIPLNDPKTFRLLQDGKTTSVFQLESSGMKRYLKQLKPTELNDIALMIALYRPGPMKLIPEYINKKFGRSKIEYLHPSLEPVLGDTYGIMIYQEQLMSAARVLAGFTLAEADILRKAVGKKIKKLLDKQRARFKTGCRKNGVSDIVADKFWSLIEPFGAYGFNKSHAMCYALIAYQTAYLKANYPLQFMAAEMNSDTSIDRVSMIINELKSMGIGILTPSVNYSDYGFIPNNNKIRFPITSIKGVGKKVSDLIVKNRGKDYKNLGDFICKLNDKILNKRVVELLALSGALDSFGERNTLFSIAKIIAIYVKEENKDILPELELPTIKKLTRGEKIKKEKELVGLYFSHDPVIDYYEELKRFGTINISDIETYLDKNIKIGGIISDYKKIITKNKKVFHTIRLQDTTGEIEIMIFNGLFNRYKNLFNVNNIVLLSGRPKENNETIRFNCSNAKFVDSL